MSSSVELDYDDLICQNILIRKGEDKSATVEVVTKQSEDFESQYNQQAEIYQIQDNLNSYLETSLQDAVHGNESDGSADGACQSDASSDYEAPIEPTKRTLSEYESSDSDWEVPKRPRLNKSNFECDECDKKCATKRGLDMHKRSHARQREKNKGTESLE